MKAILKTATAIVLSVALMCACSKPNDGKDGAAGPAGAQGPAGATGATGATGAQGEQGIPGNSGAVMYNFTSTTTTTGRTSYTIPLGSAVTLNSLIYSYFNIGGTWYPAPGLGAGLNPSYQVKVYYSYYPSTTTAYVDLYNVAGTALYATSTTIAGFKVVVVPIPADNITIVAGTLTTASKSTAINYNNYEEVAAYYGLPTQ